MALSSAWAQKPDPEVQKALQDAVRTYPPGDYKTVVPRLEEPTLLQMKGASEAKSSLRRKLDGIFFPKVEFKDAAPLKVFEWLATESVALDPNREGVPLAIDLRVFQGSQGYKPLDQAVNLSLQNVSLDHALQVATGALKLRFDLQGNTVVIRPEK